MTILFERFLNLKFITMKYHRTTIKVELNYLPTNKDSCPCFLEPAIKFIEDNITEVGIFRMNGSRLQVMKINETLSQHNPFIPPDSTVFDVASFIKLWLIELPTPLIPPSIVSTYFGPDITRATVDVLSHLSITNRLCVARLFKLLMKIIENSDKNQMTFANLSPCFVYAFTQKFQNYPATFQFQPFFQNACSHLNADGTDFNLNMQQPPSSLTPTSRRLTKTCLTPLQRRNVGYIKKSDILDAIPKESFANNVL